MNQYINPYFNIKIDFPDTWSYRYWGNRKNIPKLPERYQTAYNDMPTESSNGKELFSARSRIRRNSMLGTNFYIISLYRPNGFSLLEHRIEFESDINREFKTLSINGLEVQTLLVEAQDEGFIWYFKYYCWKYNGDIWLFCGIMSDAIESFDEVQKIVRQVINI
jgi:hypothetical protein